MARKVGWIFKGICYQNLKLAKDAAQKGCDKHFRLVNLPRYQIKWYKVQEGNGPEMISQDVNILLSQCQYLAF